MHIVGGTYKKKPLLSPKGKTTRPTSERLREALFNICQNHIQEAHFLDLFAGSGAVGLEAISRGASSATFVEILREATTLIKKNAKTLGCEEQIRPLLGDAIRLTEKLIKDGAVFDIIFVDPPYNLLAPKGQGLLASEKLIQLVDESNLLSSDGSLFVEEGTSKINDDWETLELSSLRRYGSSYLYHFIRKQM